MKAFIRYVVNEYPAGYQYSDTFGQRLADPAQSSHQTAIEAVELLHAAGHELMIVPQNVYEFWSVATRTVAHNGLGLSTSETEDIVQGFFKLFRFLKDERAIFESWIDLVATHSIKGVNSFDARLAAAMLRHDLDHLLPFNPTDFRRYEHVTILQPKKVITNGD